jgi:hypothetical protein
LAAYRSYLDKHFIHLQTQTDGQILHAEIQRWVDTANATDDGNGLSAASVRKYHTMLHSVLERSLRNRVVTVNPCAHTEPPRWGERCMRSPHAGLLPSVRRSKAAATDAPKRPASRTSIRDDRQRRARLPGRTRHAI